MHKTVNSNTGAVVKKKSAEVANEQSTLNDSYLS
jgi:hypothetical protein